MSFARKGSHKKVYTSRGHEADLEDRTPMDVEEPPKNAAIPVAPKRVCPHGGVYEDDVPMCGHCFRQPDNGLTPDQSFQAFMLSILDCCKRVCWTSSHHDFRNMSYVQKFSYAFDVVTSPKNLLKLLDPKTRNPLGVAYTMAHRRLIDLYRSPEFRKRMEQNSRELAVSQLNLPRFEDSDKVAKFSTSQKLDWLSAYGTLLEIERDSPSEYTGKKSEEDRRPTHPNRFEVLSALAIALEKSESVRVFPGVEILWTRENITRLINLAKDEMSRLPKEPFDHSVMIGLRSNAYGGKHDRSRGWDWPQLARWASSCQGKNVTEKMVRGAFERGTAQVRDYLLGFLVPSLGKIIEETPSRGRIKPPKKAA